MHEQLAYEDDDIKLTALRRAFSSPIGARHWITPSSKVSAGLNPKHNRCPLPKPGFVLTGDVLGTINEYNQDGYR
jgi:hypothetical protein